MDKRKIYIAVSILIILLIGGLIVWTLFIGNAQKKLEEPTEELGYLDSGGSFGGGFLSGFGTDNLDTESDEDAESVKAQLRQLYNLPGAGTAILTNENGVFVRFVDRATGHVFEKSIEGDNTNRILQTTVPKVYEAVFTEKGDGVIRRYLDENNSIVSVYDELIDVEDKKSIALEHNILNISVSPDGNELFYLAETPSGVQGIISKPNGDDAKNIWQSGLRGWLPRWYSDDRISVNQKPSSNIPGSVFSIDDETGVQTSTLTQIKGLISLPADQFVLYSRTATGNPTLWVYDKETGESRNLGVATFADKCTWSSIDDTIVYCALPDLFPEGNYPDGWYQGRVHFSDSFWSINVENGALEELLAPRRTHSVSLDAVNLLLDDNEEHVVFTNNTDKTIWTITLIQENADEEDSQ